MWVSMRGEKGTTALRKGTIEAESSITPQVSKDTMNFLESLEWEKVKPEQSKQEEREHRNTRKKK